MAKRSTILDVDYNPVGARLRSAVAPPIPPEPEVGISSVPTATRQQDLLHSPPAEPTPLFREPRPTEREIKDAYLRFRCSESERKKWHDIAREMTGEHNQLSHVLRACLLLLENSYEQLKKISPEMQRIKRPPVQDALGLALYEHRIAQLLFDAVKAAGRPRG
jgi:hypothetical protein